MFLLIAVVLFVLAVIPGIGRGWMVPLGLAFFAGSFLFAGALSVHIK